MLRHQKGDAFSKISSVGNYKNKSQWGDGEGRDRKNKEPERWRKRGRIGCGGTGRERMYTDISTNHNICTITD